MAREEFHPAISAAELARMGPHELAYFTDVPVAHVAAFRDFELHIARERRMIRESRAHSTRRPVVMDRVAARVFA